MAKIRQMSERGRNLLTRIKEIHTLLSEEPSPESLHSAIWKLTSIIESIVLDPEPTWETVDQ